MEQINVFCPCPAPHTHFRAISSSVKRRERGGEGYKK